ncbi:hypothetical protein BHE74_00055010 [Ensete ventricosum]|nr:hypothetical protein BHE74_00055010 [Ensete ventricosum]
MGFKAAQLQQNSLIAVWALGFTVENKNIALEIAIGYAAPTPKFSPLPLCCQAIQRPHCRLPALPTTVVAEFSGLRSSTCVTFATNARDASFSDVLAAQLSTKTAGAVLVKGETIAKLKVAINGFGRIGRNFLRCWHSRNDSPLEVVVVNDSGGVKNV